MNKENKKPNNNEACWAEIGKMTVFILSLIGYLIGALLALFVAKATAEPAQNETVVLTTYNTLTFRGEVNDLSVLDAQLKLTELVVRRGVKAYPIYLVLDSPGGSLDAGMTLIEFTKTVPNLKTISIFAASMASAIAEALPGERLALSSGTMMFHRAAGGFRGHFEVGEVESQLMFAKTIVIQMEVTNSSRMKMNLDVYKEIVHNELWLFGQNNINYRAADRLVDVVCTPTLIKKTETGTIEMLLSLFGGGSQQVEFSGCPLLRSPRSGAGARKYLVPSITNYNVLTKKVK